VAAIFIPVVRPTCWPDARSAQEAKMSPACGDDFRKSASLPVAFGDPGNE
jgi:hypothetical protein